MWKYLAQAIIFLAALIAVRGGTWNPRAKGLRKVTLTGLGTIFLALFGFIASIVVTYQSQQESKVQGEKLSSAAFHSEAAEKKAHQLEEQLNSAREKLDESAERELQIQEQTSHLRTELTKAQTELARLRGDSARQRQQTTGEYLDLRPFEYWRAPGPIYGGTIVKLLGFRNPVLLVYGPDANKEQMLSRCGEYIFRHFGQQSPYDWDERDALVKTFKECMWQQRYRVNVEILEPRLDGPTTGFAKGLPGVQLPWGLLNFGSSRAHGKSFLEWTPVDREP